MFKLILLLLLDNNGKKEELESGVSPSSVSDLISNINFILLILICYYILMKSLRKLYLNRTNKIK